MTRGEYFAGYTYVTIDFLLFAQLDDPWRYVAERSAPSDADPASLERVRYHVMPHDDPPGTIWLRVTGYARRRSPKDATAEPFEKNGIRVGERVVCIDVPRIHGTVIYCGEDGVNVRWDDGSLGEAIWDQTVAYNAYRFQVVRSAR